MRVFMTTIRTVAIIGAGQMGSGIAQAVAVGGYEVRLYDLLAERIPLAQGEIAASLARRAARGLMTPRNDVDWIDLGDTVEEIHQQLVESQHSRLPGGHYGYLAKRN